MCYSNLCRKICEYLEEFIILKYNYTYVCILNVSTYDVACISIYNYYKMTQGEELISLVEWILGRH